MNQKIENIADKFIQWVGSISSLLVHTVLFILTFVMGWIGGNWDQVLLVLTTVVSLEAIYLAIFIQMSVNKTSKSLQSVEQDLDELQEDVGEIQEDVGEIQEDVVEIQNDIDEIQEDVDEIQKDDQADEMKHNERDQTMIAIRLELEHLLKSVQKLSDLEHDK